MRPWVYPSDFGGRPRLDRNNQTPTTTERLIASAATNMFGSDCSVGMIGFVGRAVVACGNAVVFGESAGLEPDEGALKSTRGTGVLRASSATAVGIGVGVGSGSGDAPYISRH